MTKHPVPKSDAMRRRQLLASLLRLGSSVLGGVVLNGAWLAVVLATVQRPDEPLPFAVIMTAPIAAALGFALGTVVGERLTRGHHLRLTRAFWWPLVGCTVGALIAYPFGPMLVGFGIFGLGTLAVATREASVMRDPRGG